MNESLYLFLVEVEDGSGIFEVFDYTLIPKDSDMDARWSKNAQPGNYLLDATGIPGLGSNAYYNGKEFIPDGEGNVIDFSGAEKGTKIISLLYNDRVFGVFGIHPESPKFFKYDMAMHSKVICIKNDFNRFINLGDIWDGTKFIKPEELKNV